jgi:hypothetical protein
VAGVTGLEPAASGVTGRRSNQLSYTPKEVRVSTAGAGGCQASGWNLTSYARKLVTVISGGVFCKLDPVLERHSFDEFGELV